MRIPEPILIARDIVVWLNTMRRVEGWLSMIRQGLYYVACHIYIKEEFWLFRAETTGIFQKPETEVKPNLPDLRVIAVSTNRYADELEAEGIKFRCYDPRARRALNTEATCLLMLTNNEVAHFGWMLTTQKQQDILDEAPYHVDWGAEVINTHIWTHPKYRRMHFRIWGAWRRNLWGVQRGIYRRWNAIHKDNHGSLAGVSWIPGVEVMGEATYTRILGRKIWKEKAIVTKS